MNTLTIRNLDDELKDQLCLKAAMHQRTVEAEALHILRQALAVTPAATALGSKISKRFAGLGLTDFEPPIRQEMPRAANLPE